jgi:hypothetical protein
MPTRAFITPLLRNKIEQHQKRSIEEIVECLEKTNKFIYEIQTPQEREHNRKIKGKY